MDNGLFEKNHPAHPVRGLAWRGAVYGLWVGIVSIIVIFHLDRLYGGTFTPNIGGFPPNFGERIQRALFIIFGHPLVSAAMGSIVGALLGLAKRFFGNYRYYKPGMAFTAFVSAAVLTYLYLIAFFDPFGSNSSHKDPMLASSLHCAIVAGIAGAYFSYRVGRPSKKKAGLAIEDMPS